MKRLYQELAMLVAARLTCIARGNTEWVDRHETEIDRLVKTYLPSGSGFDLGTNIDLDKSTGNHLVFSTSFHHMDEHGGYDGWTSHGVRIDPDLASGFTLKVYGRNRNDIKDYIGDVFQAVLDTDHTY